MKKILLFGAGKSASCLIDYLAEQTALHNWQFTLADGNLAAAQFKLGQATHAIAVQVDVLDDTARKALVKAADIVISLLPPALHFLIAQDCIAYRKNLLTASYVDPQIKTLEAEIEKKQLLFLYEMGLDPGLDHMSAMDLIHRVKEKGGRIHSFISHTGGLVAPESDDNPWHYKISWNPRNVVMAGSAGAVYKKNNQLITKKYASLFDDCAEVSVEGTGHFAWYPNRDSLGYIPVYKLEEAETFIRTTLRFPAFCRYWKSIVAAGLTDDKEPVPAEGLRFQEWSSPISAFVDESNQEALTWLGLFEALPVPASAKTNADILQYLLETKMAMQPADKDMIVMLHELDYENGNRHYSVKSSLTVKGEDSIRTAMAKTVGLPIGIAAVLLLEGKIKLTGLHIPILPEIYTPVLKALEARGIQFTETVS